ncbi:DNA alkylation repair protein [Rhodobacter calidifons]|uniref:DNA alkylation repair protein n=1 Tax=Rhodobacter calidifons TaxID=2715277 RepID=A0ABX0GBK7_9RHOB|nr:DNA alkylation repair protein [Rhodobacter calidifons]NHB78031.1 DNA alkylation repair protein [Rhodobacter calidifons]
MTALAELEALTHPAKAAEMAAYHKVSRRYLGVPMPQIEDLTDRWRAELSLDDRIALAADLWRTNIHEARVAGAKLLTQARIRPDQAAWDLIVSWVPDFDGWALADHASIAGQKRLVADPARIDTVETWIASPHMWTRRAALVMTLPWTKQNFPKDRDLAIRARVLGWCETLASDHDWFIQKAVAWWLRDLSKHDAEATRAFLTAQGPKLKPFARKEAARHLTD